MCLKLWRNPNSSLYGVLLLMMLQELDEMKKRLKEMEEEAAALREMQAKVEKEMGAVQGSLFSLSYSLFFNFLLVSYYSLAT